MELRHAAERRRSDRLAVAEGTVVQARAEGKGYRARVENISLGGVQLAFEGEAPRAQVINLIDPVAGPISGVRVWSKGERLGLELLLPNREVERTLKTLCLVL